MICWNAGNVAHRLISQPTKGRGRRLPMCGRRPSLFTQGDDAITERKMPELFQNRASLLARGGHGRILNRNATPV
jgi:hypothetical protein